MRAFRIWFSIISAVLVTAPAWSATSEIVELRYRTASEMVMAVKPHLSSDESASGLGNKLILRLKSENRDTILSLIRQLDKRPSQLIVSVRQAGDQQGQYTEASVTGRYQTGSARVQIGEDARPLSGRVVQHETKSNRGAEQQLRVMDGQSAAFYAGHLVPVPGGTVIGDQGFVTQGGIYYQEVTTGFTVRPRVNGELVLLDIRPKSEQLQSNGSITVNAMHSVVEGRLGEWIDIGQLVQSFGQLQSGMTSYDNSQSSQRRRVEVRVELAE